jgi:hypothetical protein
VRQKNQSWSKYYDEYEPPKEDQADRNATDLGGSNESGPIHA